MLELCMISEYLVSCGNKDGTQDFKHTRQTVYQLSNNHTPSQKHFISIYEYNCERTIYVLKQSFVGFVLESGLYYVSVELSKDPKEMH